MRVHFQFIPGFLFGLPSSKARSAKAPICRCSSQKGCLPKKRLVNKRALAVFFIGFEQALTILVAACLKAASAFNPVSCSCWSKPLMNSNVFISINYIGCGRRWWADAGVVDLDVDHERRASPQHSTPEPEVADAVERALERALSLRRISLCGSAKKEQAPMPVGFPAAAGFLGGRLGVLGTPPSKPLNFIARATASPGRSYGRSTKRVGLRAPDLRRTKNRKKPAGRPGPNPRRSTPSLCLRP